MSDRSRTKAARTTATADREDTSPPPAHDQAFRCAVHDFVIVARGDAQSCRLSPGERVAGCPTCDQAAADAWAAANGDVDLVATR